MPEIFDIFRLLREKATNVQNYEKICYFDYLPQCYQCVSNIVKISQVVAKINKCF